MLKFRKKYIEVGGIDFQVVIVGLFLARFFYYGKNIIIMDKDKSDIETENYIANNQRANIIISHHNNILKYCDKVYKIQNKQIRLLNN